MTGALGAWGIGAGAAAGACGRLGLDRGQRSQARDASRNSGRHDERNAPEAGGTPEGPRPGG